MLVHIWLNPKKNSNCLFFLILALAGRLQPCGASGSGIVWFSSGAPRCWGSSYMCTIQNAIGVMNMLISNPFNFFDKNRLCCFFQNLNEACCRRFKTFKQNKYRKIYNSLIGSMIIQYNTKKDLTGHMIVGQIGYTLFFIF